MERQEIYIRRKGKRGCFYFCLLVLLLFIGCRMTKEESSFITVEFPESTTKLYYLNEERTKVISKELSLEKDTIAEQVAEMLTILEEILWKEEEKNLILDSNPIQGFVLNEETEVVTLYFASDYNCFNNIIEVLRRAAIVKTLCQLRKVSAVEIYMGSQPFMLSNGKPLGLMKVEDFVESTGANNEFYQETVIKVYFADKKGKHLVESTLKVTYNGMISTERLILNQLMKESFSSNIQSVIPKGTILNKVYVQDGVCYVDFSEEFMKIKEGISPEVTIYSVVNSLTELSNVHKVQFLIDGTIRKTYQDLEFSSCFERNLDIIEGEQ